jgi:hypothetical protein
MSTAALAYPVPVVSLTLAELCNAHRHHFEPKTLPRLCISAQACHTRKRPGHACNQHKRLPGTPSLWQSPCLHDWADHVAESLDFCYCTRAMICALLYIHIIVRKRCFGLHVPQPHALRLSGAALVDSAASEKKLPPQTAASGAQRMHHDGGLCSAQPGICCVLRGGLSHRVPQPSRCACALSQRRHALRQRRLNCISRAPGTRAHACALLAREAPPNACRTAVFCISIHHPGTLLAHALSHRGRALHAAQQMPAQRSIGA